MARTLRCLTSAGAVTLDVTGTTGYGLIAAYPSDRMWRRVVEESPHVNGDVETQRVLDAQTYSVTVMVTGTSYADAATKMQTLRDAFEQSPSWKLEVGVDGRKETWLARVADSRIVVTGGQSLGRDAGLLRRNKIECSFRVPVQPSPAIT